MSNLGAYQWITTISKRVGGPIKLLSGILGIGTGIGIGGTLLVQSKLKKHKKIKNVDKYKLSKGKTFIVSINGKNEEGLEFFIGDKYKVLEFDGSAILIEKFGDNNNPYFVSSEFLKSISNFDEN